MTPTTTNSKALIVAAIKNGTVIDHITAGQAIKIIRFLNLPAYRKLVTVGLNLPSRAMGSKDLIKVEGRELTPSEVNEVALVAPDASVNIIRNYKITRKFKVELPEKIERLIVCPNLNCITNHERMLGVFRVSRHKTIELACIYCEKVFSRDEIKDYNL